VSDLPPDASRIMNVVGERWPNMLTIEPSDVGMTRTSEAARFLRVIHELCDEGLLSYEALVSDHLGPRVIDASLTARGMRVLAESVRCQTR
jgi:hypothetical protein